MLKRQIPNRECFKLCIAGINSTLMILIKLGKADRHFSASRTRCRYDDQRMGSFDIIIFAIAFITDNERNIGRISRDIIMDIDRDIQLFQAVLEQKGTFLS